MPRRTYWRENWHSRLSLRKNLSSQGAPICKNPTPEMSGVRPENHISMKYCSARSARGRGRFIVNSRNFWE